MPDPENAPTTRIGELAAAVGINPKTIRYYEQIGLLPPPRRTRAGYRLYGPADRQRLEFIIKARAIGLGLEAINEILTLRRAGEQPCAHVLDLLDRKLAAVEAHLRALHEFRRELLGLRDAAAESVGANGGVCPIIEHHQLTHRTEPCDALTTAPPGRLRRHSGSVPPTTPGSHPRRGRNGSDRATPA